MSELLHVADESEYQAATHSYVPSQYSKDGFIHCCQPSQLSGVLERWFASADRVLLLTVDQHVLESDIRYATGPGGQKFPHLYAAIPRKAVLAASVLKRGPNGLWDVPPLLPGRPIPSAEELAQAFRKAYSIAAEQHALPAKPNEPAHHSLKPLEEATLVTAMEQLRGYLSGWGDVR